MANLFRREAAVSFNQGKPIVNDRFVFGNRIPGLRISFDVTLDINREKNRAQCTIFNLSETTRGELDKLKPQIEIEAGYPETLGVIFNGEVTSISFTKAPTGYETRIEGKEGIDTRTKLIKKSFAAGTSFGEIIAVLAEALGIDARRAAASARSGVLTTTDPVSNNGVTLSGQVSKYLDDYAKTYKFNWSIQQGELLILAEDGTLPGETILLTPDSGLILAPQQIKDEKFKDKFIIKASSLLQPTITPGRRVRILSDRLSGTFKVRKVRHAGDTHGSDWLSEFEGHEI